MMDDKQSAFAKELKTLLSRYNVRIGIEQIWNFDGSESEAILVARFGDKCADIDLGKRVEGPSNDE